MPDMGNFTRRDALRLAPALILGRKAGAQDALPPIAKGRFNGSAEALQQYRIPEWFRDAKFGIWAHWGPQSGVEAGDWYARNMYIETQQQYKDHVARFGHPSKVGYKDLDRKSTRLNSSHEWISRM